MTPSNRRKNLRMVRKAIRFKSAFPESEMKRMKHALNITVSKKL